MLCQLCFLLVLGTTPLTPRHTLWWPREWKALDLFAIIQSRLFSQLDGYGGRRIKKKIRKKIDIEIWSAISSFSPYQWQFVGNLCKICRFWVCRLICYPHPDAWLLKRKNTYFPESAIFLRPCASVSIAPMFPIPAEVIDLIVERCWRDRVASLPSAHLGMHYALVPVPGR